MNDKEPNLDRVARRLDGEQVQLTDAERRLAAELRSDEQAVADALNATPPARSLHRAKRRAHAAAARPGRKWLRRTLEVATAAAVLLALLFWPGERSPERPPELSAEQLAAVYESSNRDVDLDVIAEQLASMEAELMLAAVEPEASELEAIERAMESFWLEEPEGWDEQSG